MHNAGTTLSGQPRVGTWPEVERRKDGLRRRIVAAIANHIIGIKDPELFDLIDEIASVLRNATVGELEEFLR